MGDMTLKDIFLINPAIMGFLFACSILILTFLLERCWAYWVSPALALDMQVADRIKMLLRQGQVKEAIVLCSKGRDFLSKTMEVALNAANFPREEMENIFVLYHSKLQRGLGNWLAMFGTFAFIGPLVGLLGTVLGVIKAFHDLALSGSGGPTIVAAGIAEALITTAGGIAVAVSSAIFYNIFTANSRGRLQQFDQTCQEIAILNYTGTDKGKR